MGYRASYDQRIFDGGDRLCTGGYSVKGESLGIGGYLDIGLIDTMKDLIVNFIGAVVFSIIGYFYIKNRGKGRFAKRFIPRLKSKDADFLKKAVEEEEREEQALLSEKTSMDSKSS